MERRALGICLGASTIKVVELHKTPRGVAVSDQKLVRHDGNPRAAFEHIVGQLDLSRCDFAAITGRKLRTLVRAHAITEPEAAEHALAFLRQESRLEEPPRAIASLGAENFVVFLLGKSGHIESVETGNKCASGTGEFFLQQIGRMDIDVEQAVALARGSDIYKVSGRCTVFCKSDCTHALNKGVPIGRVTSGLCQMMADKVTDLLGRSKTDKVFAVGGVTKNAVILDKLNEQIAGLCVPEHAEVFEALGAAYHALKKEIPCTLDPDDLYDDGHVSFDFLPPIPEAEPLVRFESRPQGKAKSGDECVLGLDVGSTTTKASVLRMSDRAVLASVYLRTGGNPVRASRQCYRALADELEVPIRIVGLGTTGSGRQIAGLHAQTEAIINEIVAHATGAAFFDPEVDTIFEIGGQDAKYTHLTGGVPSDYAMNEACSAGTGSFLEESAKESMGVDFTEIAAVALRGTRPPNFNDQCAAFISSDIKTAVHEGIGKDDIVAGLVYSICQNYVNRVKGARAVGTKVFMQGGVCYNGAVPLAMANLLGKEIIVPPDPGLVGAFGVALEVADRIERGVIERSQFDLTELAGREIEHGRSFICRGGKERCDLACEIRVMKLGGVKYPFGGACNKWYNQVHNIEVDPIAFDHVRRRQELVFDTHAAKAAALPTGSKRPLRIGINRTFLVNRFYPLYSTFFQALGCEVVLSDEVCREGIARTGTEFCFPAQIAHGAFENLLRKGVDFVFLPKIFSLPVDGGTTDRKWQATCILLMSEAYWLKAAFGGDPRMPELLEPQLDLNEGFEPKSAIFADIAVRLGKTRSKGLEAFSRALRAQDAYQDDLKAVGRRALQKLEADQDAIAVVLFGRPYNAFAREANLAIPAKLASRGVVVIPWDSLPYEQLPIDPNINWAVGQDILRAAKLVKQHPRLFGTFVTNFSCGPDSFLVGYFRDIMKTKPSLTLELDSHSADAGINTRIEAFLDVVQKYRQVRPIDPAEDDFQRARVDIIDKKPMFITSDGHRVSLEHPKAHVIFPSMGPLGTDIFAAAFRGLGMHASGLPIPDFESLKAGRGNTSCKECLPMQLVTGGLLRYLEQRQNDDEYLVYFMPTSAGGCRLTQYSVYLNKLIEKKKLRNVALLSLTNTNGYGGLQTRDILNVLKGVIISDAMEDVRAALRVLAVDKAQAEEVFAAGWQRILDCFEKRRARQIFDLVESVSATLAKIPLRYPLTRARKVALSGEMYVRRDYFSCQDLVERLAQRDIIALRAPVYEYLAYSDYNVEQNLWENKVDKLSLGQKTEQKVKTVFQRLYERAIKKSLSRSGLLTFEMLDIPQIVRYGERFFDKRFTGESIVIVGAFFKEMLHSVHGLISIGPFACMPTRVVESVLGADSSMATKRSLDRAINGQRYESPQHQGISSLPFFSIESDGNPFPQIVDARLEVFCLQVERLHEKVVGRLPN